MAQQNTIILENNLKITFIYHSGFAVETPDCTLLFDYYRGDIPEFAAEKPLYVFSSHKHADHLISRFLTWQKNTKRYITFCPRISAKNTNGNTYWRRRG